MDPGAALAIFRVAAGLSQLQLAQILGCTQTTIWRLEAGKRKSLYDIRELLRFADTIGMPRQALLPLVLGHHGHESAGALQRSAADERGTPDPGPSFVDGDPGTSVQVRTASTEYLLACVERLYLRDLAAGGGSVRAQALQLWSRACRQLDEADYDDLAGRELMKATGELAVLAGWACYDSDDPDRARRLYADGQLRAGQAGDDRLAVHAMVNNALLFTELAQLGRAGLARQAIWLTAQAAELARRDQSPRLHALIAAREAIARAVSGDRAGFKAAITRAWRELDREQHDDDPAWLGFVRQPEIAVHEAKGRTYLGDGGAVGLYRDSLRDQGLSPRNAVIYRAQLAAALAADGDIGQAVSEAGLVLDRLDGTVSSPRALAQLRSVCTAARQAGLEEFAARYDAAASPDRDSTEGIKLPALRLAARPADRA